MNEIWEASEMERARTRVLREARKAVPMLTDALHALRHDRTAITDEFLERTIRGLTDALADSDEIVATVMAGRQA